MYTLAQFTSDEVFKYVSHLMDNEKKKIGFNLPDGRTFQVKVSSQRLVLFKQNPSCVCCGIKGSIILLQRNTNNEIPHFNFYAVVNNKLVLMTKDHILPKSKNGLNSFNNLQTMCKDCNVLKGNYPITNKQLLEIRGLYLSLLNQGKSHNEAFHKIEKVKKQMCIKNEQKNSIGDRIS